MGLDLLSIESRTSLITETILRDRAVATGQVGQVST